MEVCNLKITYTAEVLTRYLYLVRPNEIVDYELLFKHMINRYLNESVDYVEEE